MILKMGMLLGTFNFLFRKHYEFCKNVLIMCLTIMQDWFQN